MPPLKERMYGHDKTRSMFGVYVQQTWAAMYVYEKILQEHPKVRAIVELGSGNGALSVFFAVWAFQHGMAFATVDKNTTKTKKLLEVLRAATTGRIRHHRADMYEGDYIEVMVRGTRHKDEPMLILCDGRYKARELMMVAPFVYKDDILIAHDYGREVFDKDIPPGFEKYEGWHSAAFKMDTRQLILRRK